MPGVRRPLTVLLALIAAAPLAALAGCGGGEDSARERSGTTTTAPGDGRGGENAPRAGGVPGLPAGVPLRADRTGVGAADRRVIDGWLAALRAGRIGPAAAYFAPRARVANGTPVLTLGSAADRRAFNAAFPCGAVAERYGTSRGYVVVEYRLTERRGGNCEGAAGMPARGAIRVSGGRITEWYRLPDDPEADPSAPPAEPRLDLGGAEDA